MNQILARYSDWQIALVIIAYIVSLALTVYVTRSQRKAIRDAKQEIIDRNNKRKMQERFDKMDKRSYQERMNERYGVEDE